MRHKRITAFLVLVILLLTFAAMTRFSSSSASLSPSSPTPQQFGGRGGYSQGSQAPTPTIDLTVHNCLGYLVSPKNAIAIVFINYGISVDFLSDKYKTTDTPILCFDHWNWQKAQPLQLSEVLTALGWPADLFQAKYLNYTYPIGPLSEQQKKDLEAATKGTYRPATTTTNQQSTSTTDNNCKFTINVIFNPTIDLCGLARTIINAVIATPLRVVFGEVLKRTDGFLWTTSPDLTYKDTPRSATLHTYQTISLTLLWIALAAAIAWSAIRLMLGGAVSWLQYANIAEIAPRLVLAVVLACLSMQVTRVVIDTSNALGAVFNGAGLLEKMTQAAPDGLIAVVLQVAYICLAFGLIIEEVARFAVLYVLIAFLPLIFGCFALRETSKLAAAGVKALLLFSLLQPLQLALISLGGSVASGVTGSSGLDILNLLAGLAILFLSLTLFFGVARASLGHLGTSFGLAVTGAATAASFLMARRYGTATRESGGKLFDAGLRRMPGAAQRAGQAVQRSINSMPAAAYRAGRATGYVLTTPVGQQMRAYTGFAAQTMRSAYAQTFGRRGGHRGNSSSGSSGSGPKSPPSTP